MILAQLRGALGSVRAGGFIALLALLAWAALLSPARAADKAACQLPAAVPSTLQVAWVSPIREGVGLSGVLDVVRTSDLRALVLAEKREPAAVLRAIGLLGRRQRVRRDYKVTLFDVKSEWLCRPSEGPPGEDHAGVPRCEERLQRRGRDLRRSAWTDCGYLTDTADGDRSLDLFRVRWRDAIAGGFCVLPLERFMQGV